MSLDGDLVWGILKPLKDAVGALLLYVVFTKIIPAVSSVQSSITANIGFSFNIWVFVPVFGIVSLFDDFGSQIYWDFKKSYYEPLDQVARIYGMLIGMVFFGGPLVLIYNVCGGSIGDGIFSWFISFAILIITMVLRVKIDKSNRGIR